MKKLTTLALALLFVLCLATASLAAGNTFDGLVTANSGSTFTVTNSFGSSLTFSKGAGLAILPSVGSTVSVTFSGDITTQMVAESVVIQNAPVTKTASGVIRGFSGQQMVLETKESVLLTIYVNDATVISGKATTLAVGQSVKVVYAETVQFVSVVDIASSVEVTAVAEEEKTVDVDVKEKEEKDTTNKTLTGTVTSLSGSKVTIKTSKGKKWSFRLTKYTAYSGKYDFEEGCTVKVTYDGYASDTPAAKKIKVTKAASHEPKTYTKKGYCTYFGGMVIEVDGSFTADVTHCKHSGNGERCVGSMVKVTYYYDDYGNAVAKKIKWSIPTNSSSATYSTNSADYNLYSGDESGIDIW